MTTHHASRPTTGAAGVAAHRRGVGAAGAGRAGARRAAQGPAGGERGMVRRCKSGLPPLRRAAAPAGGKRGEGGPGGPGAGTQCHPGAGRAGIRPDGEGGAARADAR
ncbi:hypothetical protein ACKKBG_A26075 [Auxenochlorella protothecoides x Auxenochlorella symbiontica]